MDLQDLRVFSRVAALCSFTRAAEQLGLGKGQASAVVQRLEAEVGARLLNRTTRLVQLTPEGEVFLARCDELLAEAESLHTLFQPAAAGLRGRLRIDLPNTFAREVVIPRLPQFLAAHPALEVGLSTTDLRVDVVREGFDCVLRVGTLADSELVARPVGELPMVNLASPDYLRVHGTPKTLADLAQHRVVHYAAKLGTAGAGWESLENGERRLLPMRCSVVVNSTDAYQAACVAGLGLIQAPWRGARALLAEGRLVQVLPAHTAPALPVSLLYPHRRHVPARVQALLQWLADVVGEALAADAAALARPPAPVQVTARVTSPVTSRERRRRPS